jgi:hypothetical protein
MNEKSLQLPNLDIHAAFLSANLLFQIGNIQVKNDVDKSSIKIPNNGTYPSTNSMGNLA